MAHVMLTYESIIWFSDARRIRVLEGPKSKVLAIEVVGVVEHV